MIRLHGILVFFFVTVLLWGQSALRHGEMEVRVHLRTPEEIQRLRELKLMDEPAIENGQRIARVYVTPSELEKLRASGLYYIIAKPDTGASATLPGEKGILESYHNYNQLVDLSDSLAAAYPGICRKFILGTSPGGRQYGILKISDNVAVNENEAEIMFDGGIHGDEIMGPEIVIRYARDICAAYGTDPVITQLIDSREIWLYYLVNPDGFVNGSRYNSNGVDINRDAGFMWGAEGYSPSPFSQPETKILRSLWHDHNFSIYTNFHGGTEVIAYPWSYRISLAPDWVHINQLASAYSEASGYPDLIYGQGCVIMYQIMGSTKDYNYGVLGQVGWSIEVSYLKQPPPGQIPMYYGYNKPAMNEMIYRAGWGVEGTVTDSVTGSPVRAALFVGSFYPVFTDPQVGDYHKYLLPGTYTITVKASGYETKTVTGVTVPAGGSVNTDIQMVPLPKWYACKAIVTRIPYFPSTGAYLDESYVPGIIGSPDSVNYSIGSSGTIIIDMGDTVYDAAGNDFRVHEGDTSPEGYTCQVSQNMDGTWTDLGIAVGTTAFNLSDGPISKARYIKIIDLGGGSGNAPDAGFDLDALEFITPPLIPGFNASNTTPCLGEPVDFFDVSTGNPTGWLWQFQGGIPPSSTEQNPAGITYSVPGQYDVTLTVTNGYAQVSATRYSFIQAAEDLVVDLGPDTTVCPWESLILDAGNPGCDYLWTTGDTTQTIVVDSATFGMGTHIIQVVVTNALDCTGSDTVSVTIDACTGLAGGFSGRLVQIYPNPSDGTFRLIVHCTGDGILDLLNTQGQLIYSARLEPPVTQRTISLPTPKRGIYLLRLKTDLVTVTEKVIIQ